ncbi:MAG: HNH endonuclease [Rhodanobacter sp.]
MATPPSILLSVCRDVRFRPAPGHTSAADLRAAKFRQAAIGQTRFGRRCYFCDFGFGQGDDFEVHHLDGDHTNTQPDNLVPVCVWCHAPWHLDLLALRWREDPGQIIYLPEIKQAQLNNLLQVIAYAKAEQQRQGKLTDPNATATGSLPKANTLYIELARRSQWVEQGREGLSQPAILARVLTEMSEEDYRQRDTLLQGLRYLPPEGRLVEQAVPWHEPGAAFAALDVSSWPSIAGLNA